MMNNSFENFKNMINSNNQIIEYLKNKNDIFLRGLALSENSTFGTMEGFWGLAFEDASSIDLSYIPVPMLSSVPFSTYTKFPVRDKLPFGFDYLRILYGSMVVEDDVKQLHKAGILGQGVTIAVIDFPMEFSHREFKDSQIEYVQRCENAVLEHHGYGVVSRIIGRDLGIAPASNLIYYPLNIKQGIRVEERINQIAVDTLNCFREILNAVKSGKKIDIVSVSGTVENCGNEEILNEYKQIKDELKSLGCEVFTISEFYGKYNCDYVHKKDATISSKNLDNYYLSSSRDDVLTMIDGGKAIAMPFTTEDYLYKARGCASYTLPQFVATYALAKQVNKNISLDDFMAIARKTSVKNKKGVNFVRTKELIKEIEGVKRNYDSGNECNTTIWQ